MGLQLGIAVTGDTVGWSVGLLVGLSVGDVGEPVGLDVGGCVGDWIVGLRLGSKVGPNVGTTVVRKAQFEGPLATAIRSDVMKALPPTTSLILKSKSPAAHGGHCMTFRPTYVALPENLAQLPCSQK